jgi:uncharacterized protein (TIGR02453 family)
MDGPNKMISMLPAISAGEDIWKACASFVKPARVKRLEVKDTGNNYSDVLFSFLNGTVVMKNVSISNSSLDFLKALTKNNNREWFNKNKNRYLQEYENMIVFADALLTEMRKHDNIETASGKDSLFRIYRDTRFSKDKTPYKTYWAGSFKRATKKLRGGYYFQIEPGGSMAAGGFFSPNPVDLLRIRQDIDLNFSDWKKILSGKKIAGIFGKLKGEQVSNAPKGFSKDNPAIELLKHKQFYFERKLSDKEVLAPGFLKDLNHAFKNLRPYFDYMSEVLTTDLNGVSTV